MNKYPFFLLLVMFFIIIGCDERRKNTPAGLTDYDKAQVDFCFDFSQIADESFPLSATIILKVYNLEQCVFLEYSNKPITINLSLDKKFKHTYDGFNISSPVLPFVSITTANGDQVKCTRDNNDPVIIDKNKINPLPNIPEAVLHYNASMITNKLCISLDIDKYLDDSLDGTYLSKKQFTTDDAPYIHLLEDDVSIDCKKIDVSGHCEKLTCDYYSDKTYSLLFGKKELQDAIDYSYTFTDNENNPIPDNIITIDVGEGENSIIGKEYSYTDINGNIKANANRVKLNISMTGNHYDDRNIAFLHKSSQNEKQINYPTLTVETDFNNYFNENAANNSVIMYFYAIEFINADNVEISTLVNQYYQKSDATPISPSFTNKNDFGYFCIYSENAILNITYLDNSTVIFVDPNTDDVNGDGTFDNPYDTVSKAFLWFESRVIDSNMDDYTFSLVIKTDRAINNSRDQFLNRIPLFELVDGNKNITLNICGYYDFNNPSQKIIYDADTINFTTTERTFAAAFYIKEDFKDSSNNTLMKIDNINFAFMDFINFTRKYIDDNDKVERNNFPLSTEPSPSKDKIFYLNGGPITIVNTKDIEIDLSFKVDNCSFENNIIDIDNNLFNDDNGTTINFAQVKESASSITLRGISNVIITNCSFTENNSNVKFCKIDKNPEDPAYISYVNSVKTFSLHNNYYTTDDGDESLYRYKRVLSGAILIIGEKMNIEVSHSHFEKCMSYSSGGALYISDEGNVSNHNKLLITNSCFRSNYATLTGGAIYIHLNKGNIDVNNCMFDYFKNDYDQWAGNSSSMGGSIYADLYNEINISNTYFIKSMKYEPLFAQQSTITFDVNKLLSSKDVLFYKGKEPLDPYAVRFNGGYGTRWENTPSTDAEGGGAIFLQSFDSADSNRSANITNSYFVNCFSFLVGGAIRSTSYLNIDNTLFYNCKAFMGGGAIVSNDSILNIHNSIITNCISEIPSYVKKNDFLSLNYGGAIHLMNNSGAFITNSIIKDCYVGGPSNNNFSAIYRHSDSIDSTPLFISNSIIKSNDKYTIYLFNNTTESPTFIYHSLFKGNIINNHNTNDERIVGDLSIYGPENKYYNNENIFYTDVKKLPIYESNKISVDDISEISNKSARINLTYIDKVKDKGSNDFFSDISFSPDLSNVIQRPQGGRCDIGVYEYNDNTEVKTIYVGDDDCNYGIPNLDLHYDSLTAAINLINQDNDNSYNIVVRTKTYPESGIVINKPVSIFGKKFSKPLNTVYEYIEDMTTIDCEGLGQGSAMTVSADGVRIEGIKFMNGNATDGGAVFVDASNVWFEKCEFANNTADNWGGAIRTTPGSTGLNISRCKFYGNNANGSAGDGQGGAIYLDDNLLDAITNTAIVSNCLFYDNRAIDSRAIYSRIATDNGLKIYFCTFYSRIDPTTCLITSTGADVRNSIFFNDFNPPTSDTNYFDGTNNTLLKSRTSGAGLLFYKADTNDFHLNKDSETCIDYGIVIDDGGVEIDASKYDIEGYERPRDDKDGTVSDYNIGAYEYIIQDSN